MEIWTRVKPVPVILLPQLKIICGNEDYNNSRLIALHHKIPVIIESCGVLPTLIIKYLKFPKRMPKI